MQNPAYHPTPTQRAAMAAFLSGLAVIGVAGAAGWARAAPAPWFGVAVLTFLAALVYVADRYGRLPAGVRTEGTAFSANQSRGHVAWVLGVLLTALYVLIYWFPFTLEGLVAVVDPLSRALRGRPATIAENGQWFLYGTLYTAAVVVMGVRALLKYRHSRYHLVRTCSVIFFQLVVAYLLPQLLVRAGRPELYFSYFWPLDYDHIFPSNVDALRGAGALGTFALFWGVAMIVLATPVLTYFFGKRWYCSWVCGCGGLAETAGDPYRQLSEKSVRAWQIERWMVHGVLVFVVATTALLWLDRSYGLLGSAGHGFARAYGFWIGALFAGVVGVGFYPILGNRVWCRFGCPMAAILGLQQRFFSRFRITTNGGQCISCGNCSTYCEMGIDVRWYAQRGQNVVRAGCVGCGVCATVCPRGVLRLENGPAEGRFGEARLSPLFEDLDVL